jgi:hypothetical protein
MLSFLIANGLVRSSKTAEGVSDPQKHDSNWLPDPALHKCWCEILRLYNAQIHVVLRNTGLISNICFRLSVFTAWNAFFMKRRTGEAFVVNRYFKTGPRQYLCGAESGNKLGKGALLLRRYAVLQSQVIAYFILAGVASTYCFR